MTLLQAVDELVRAVVWFGLGLGLRAVVSSPFVAGRWPGGDGE